MTTPTSGFNKRLNPVEVNDEGVVLVPFGFRVNGTTDPDELQGDMLASVSRTEAGEFLCTLNAKPAKCFYGDAEASTGERVDLVGKVNWDSVVSSGTFVVRTVAANGIETDPDDDVLVGGFLLVKKTTRSRTGA